MRDEPIEISQGFLGSLRLAVPPLGGGGGGEGTATRTLLEFLNQCHLEVGDQVTGQTFRS